MPLIEQIVKMKRACVEKGHAVSHVQISLRLKVLHILLLLMIPDLPKNTQPLTGGWVSSLSA